jgi:hypothetical protein
MVLVRSAASLLLSAFHNPLSPSVRDYAQTRNPSTLIRASPALTTRMTC